MTVFRGWGVAKSKICVRLGKLMILAANKNYCLGDTMGDLIVADTSGSGGLNSLFVDCSYLDDECSYVSLGDFV